MSNNFHICFMLRHFSCVWLFVTQWTTDCQDPLSMELSGKEYWSGLPFPSPGDLPNRGIQGHLLHLLHWQAGSHQCHLGSSYILINICYKECATINIFLLYKRKNHQHIVSIRFVTRPFANSVSPLHTNEFFFQEGVYKSNLFVSPTKLA